MPDFAVRRNITGEIAFPVCFGANCPSLHDGKTRFTETARKFARAAKQLRNARREKNRLFMVIFTSCYTLIITQGKQYVKGGQ
jgi:hypothetical protein